jgi:hypothetical protein
MLSSLAAMSGRAANAFASDRMLYGLALIAALSLAAGEVG